MKSTVLIATLASLSLAGLAPTYAQGPKEMTLLDGTVHKNAGAMFQYLRERDNGLAAGNPKAIVDAYPDEFENVGDLIEQKRSTDIEQESSAQIEVESSAEIEQESSTDAEQESATE
ncbi:hypothetical protein [Devosia nitrariae]|uniref:Uncharacterized protein n=1 Tax=Devosia nitrariae TaxID=2071872 RepID=A0ABQ5VZ31_9HYPH|nr:hypothetical protein [Devosia nitrariae]GLQ52811.1 hypothetical protein GCM10010862_00690 [Devosia nitrariae]